MPDSFGARLRERREQQHVALTTIAEQTKIKVSLLEALERDDVSHWPSGIFRRAFIRAYALAIGLEPDTVVREFLDLYPDPIEIVEPILAMSGAEGASLGDGPPTRFRHFVASAIGSMSRLRTRAPQRSGPLFDPPIAAPPPVDSVIAAEDVPAFEEQDNPVLPRREAAIASPVAAIETAPPEPVLAVDVEPQPPIVPQVPPPRIQEELLVPATYRIEPDLMDVAGICTELGRAESTDDVQPLLQETSRILDAVGIIVWVWDPIASELRPALAHGYSDRVLAQLPRVERETNNATAAAFRAAQTCVVKSSEQVSGALAVPLMTPAGCAGVLAIELTHRREDRGSVRALATIFAAQLAALIGASRPAEATGRMFA
jgi:transcriptional regulator with XRE-family HTH domain